MNQARFLIYDFQMDSVCGLSPTLVLIRKAHITQRTFNDEFADVCLRNEIRIYNDRGINYNRRFIIIGPVENLN